MGNPAIIAESAMFDSLTLQTGKGIKVGKTRARSDRKIYKRASRPISVFCSGSKSSKPPERFPTGQIRRSLWVPSVLESSFRRRDSASFPHGINTYQTH